MMFLDKKEIPIKSKIIQALKQEPLEYSDLLKKVELKSTEKSKLSYWLKQLQGNTEKNKPRYIEKIKDKHPTTYKLIESNQTHELIIQALIEDDCKHKSLYEIKKIIGKKAPDKEIEEALLQGIEKNSIFVSKLVNSTLQNVTKTYHHYGYLHLSGTDVIQSTFGMEHNGGLLGEDCLYFIPYDSYKIFEENKICLRCKKKIKPNDKKIFRSYTSHTTQLYCFHIECIDKTITNPDRQKDLCSYCYLPLSRGQLIKELNINWNDETLVKKIDQLFEDSPIDIIWSSTRKEIYKEHIENYEDLADARAAWDNGDPVETETAYKKYEPNRFTCKEIDGKKYHPYCAKQIKKKSN